MIHTPEKGKCEHTAGTFVSIESLWNSLAQITVCRQQENIKALKTKSGFDKNRGKRSLPCGEKCCSSRGSNYNPSVPLQRNQVLR